MMTKTNRCGREVTIPLRPNTSTVSWVALFAFLGVLMLMGLSVVEPLHPPLSWFLVSISTIILAPALLCVFYRCHACLLLSETGLLWRTWGDWRRTSWGGVNDYYDQPPKSGSKEDDLMTIETDAGNITLNRHWHESDEVRQIVQQQARGIATAEWGIQGQRTSGIDSRTFSYNQKDFWFAVIYGIGLCLPYTFFGWRWLLSRPKGGSFWGIFAGAWDPVDLWSSLFDTAFVLLLMVFMIFIVNVPLLILAAGLPAMLDVRRCRAERITVRRDGITFDDGRRHIAAAWHEVTGYFLQPSVQSRSPLLRATALSSSPILPWRWVYVIETTQGSFQYSAFIDGSKQLGQIIKERAMPLQGRGFAIR